MEEIDNVYVKMNNIFCNDMNYENNSINRNKIKELLQIELGDKYKIKCDEENNPCDVMENFCLVTKIKWDYSLGGKYKYCNLIFGNINSVLNLYQTINTIN